MGGGAKQAEEKKEAKGGFGISEKKNAFPKNDGASINFNKSRPPTFHKTENVGSKGDFPELGVEEKKVKQPIKPSAPVDKVVAEPARTSYKPSFVSNKQEGAKREETHIIREEPKLKEEVKNEPPKERPRFTGNIKGLLAK